MTPYAEAATIILGADGFLGRNLLDFWRNRAWNVYPVGRTAGDFRNPQVVDSVFREAPRAGRIIHAVTKQRTGAIQYEMQGELLRDNSRIHLNVLDAWRAYQPQAKLISLGSSCVYPESPDPLPEEAFGSGAPHPSVRGYALAKETLAIGCETFGAQYGMKWLHCILATVYGPHAHIEAGRSHFMAAMIHRAEAAKAGGAAEFEVWGSPDTVRDLLFVNDQIEAIIAADLLFENRVLNVSSNRPVTIGECARQILKAFDWSPSVVYPQGSFQGAQRKTLDSSRFLAATGWRPGCDIETGVRTVLLMNSAG